MKIAIPTSDGIYIAENLFKANGFITFTIQFGEIIEEELRHIFLSDLLPHDNGIFTNVADCSVFFISDLDKRNEKLLQDNKRELIFTNETIITKIVMNYLNTCLQKESNTLCCP
jgi:hypothetical protein